MAAELILAPEVEDDLDKAYAWYEEQQIGLGEEFLTCADACFQRICRSPEMFEKVHEEYRRALVRRFPYMVFLSF